MMQTITPNINKHMIHAEDLVFLGGENGLKLLINMFKQLYIRLKLDDETVNINISVKYDGSPAVFAWSEFPGFKSYGIAIKSIFAKNPKILYNEDDIEKYYGTQKDLAIKLKLLLKYVPELNFPKGEIWQGDFLFDKDTLIDEGLKYSFHPNTIIYKILKDSDIGEKISKSDIGIVWHTKYKGTSLSDIYALYNININDLNFIDKVFMFEPSITMLKDLNIITRKEALEFMNLLLDIEIKYFKLDLNNNYKNLLLDKELINYLITFQNYIIIHNIKINNFIDYLEEFMNYIDNKLQKEIDSRKTEKGKNLIIEKKQLILDKIEYNDSICNIVEIMQEITKLKHMFIEKLNNNGIFETYLTTDNITFIPTKDEGFVISDITGNIIKLINRNNFSFANFSSDISKGWSK